MHPATIISSVAVFAIEHACSYTEVMTIAYWACVSVTVISALTSLGFAVSAFRSSSGGTTSHMNAMYALSRSTALAIVSLVPLAYHSRSWLIPIAITMTTVQALDGIVGVRISDFLKTIGPTVIAVLNLLTILWLVRY
jgi:hypothetical protein